MTDTTEKDTVIPDHSCEDTFYKYGVPCPCPKATPADVERGGE